MRPPSTHWISIYDCNGQRNSHRESWTSASIRVSGIERFSWRYQISAPIGVNVHRHWRGVVVSICNLIFNGQCVCLPTPHPQRPCSLSARVYGLFRLIHFPCRFFSRIIPFQLFVCTCVCAEWWRRMCICEFSSDKTLRLASPIDFSE